MEIEAVDSALMPPPLGPYSHVVRAGELLFVSGQPGIDPRTGEAPQKVSRPRQDRHSTTCARCWRRLAAAWTVWSRRPSSWPLATTSPS